MMLTIYAIIVCMNKILLLSCHPNLETSFANQTLVDSACELDGVTVHDLSAAYPDFGINVAHEQALLLDHNAIIFQSPTTTAKIEAYKAERLA